MKQSAGILLFRRHPSLEFFLVHPGGPYFARKDKGWWTIPKGEYTPPEVALTAAIREFEEEIGKVLSGDFVPLPSITQKGGKIVHCWALEGDINPEKFHSNTFQIEWPPKSGRQQVFPEIDKAGWFEFTEADSRINARQALWLHQLPKLL